ncbi:MAG: rhomboid family intramembrane serine protease [Pseudomonadota bacterium]
MNSAKNPERYCAGYWPKARHILPAYLTVMLVTVGGLTAIRLAVDRFAPKLEINQDLWELWIPLVVAALAHVIWLRPRLKILTFKNKTAEQVENQQTMLGLIALITLWAPSIFAQFMVLQAVATLHDVDSVLEISLERPHRYYAIRDYNVLTRLGGLHTNSKIIDRGNSIEYAFYFAYPVTEADAPYSNDHRYWYGLIHRERVSNYLSNASKDRVYREAYNRGLELVENYDFTNPSYVEVARSSQDRDHFRSAVGARTGNDDVDNVLILLPGEGAFEDSLKLPVVWPFYAAGIGIIIFLLTLLLPTYDNQALQAQKDGKKPSSFIADYGFFFLPNENQFFAPVITSATCLVFVMMTLFGVHPIYPTADDLLTWGANRRAETTQGQWWRLVTSMFVHGGLMHLFYNVAGLVLASLFLEELFSRVRCFVIYFVSGLSGSLASIWWYENATSVGASGAIFGLFGAVFASGVLGEVRLREIAWLWTYVGLGLVFGFVAGGIDNAAHLGGLFAGFLAGLALHLFARSAEAHVE